MPEAVSRPPESEPYLPGSISRRALLGRGAALGAGVLVLPWLAGCTAEAAAPHADLPALVGAIASEQNLIATYEAARSVNASLAGRLDSVLAHHREHLAVLKRHYVPGSGDRADEGGAIPPPTASPVPRGSGVLVVLREAEERAAEQRRAEAAKAAPGLAQLLASIGACEAGHAMRVKGQAPVVRSKSGAEAVQTALAVEHAAVYGYGVLGARLQGPLRQTAKAVWNAHRAQRDALISLLSGTPVAAATVYKLPVKVASARSAAQLAAVLEDDLVPAYVGLAGVSAPDLRAFAADSAQRAMARSAAWRTKAGGAAPRNAFPGLPSTALFPRPEVGE
ncbi:ferritin-like domain-containing protein [Actinomadura sp. 3N508]|uniref:ferritin-like domain-containing protein n=1 Tax=Actinomadura sp. 3N508 TaxID=3375153 RepID=UPI00378EF3D4